MPWWRHGMEPAQDLLDHLRPPPRCDASLLDGLDLEVHRTVRHQSDAPASDPVEETA